MSLPGEHPVDVTAGRDAATLTDLDRRLAALERAAQRQAFAATGGSHAIGFQYPLFASFIGPFNAGSLVAFTFDGTYVNNSGGSQTPGWQLARKLATTIPASGSSTGWTAITTQGGNIAVPNGGVLGANADYVEKVPDAGAHWYAIWWDSTGDYSGSTLLKNWAFAGFQIG